MEPSTDRARRLRRNQTDAERRLWGRLRDRRLLGVKFYRQYSIGPFFVDFYSLVARLVIEVDGSQHAEHAGDQSRTDFLTQHEYRVLRFWNNEVLGNIEGVQEAIANAVLEFRQLGNS